MKFLLGLLFVAFTLNVTGQDSSEKVRIAMKNGDAKTLAEMFDSQVDLALEDIDDVFSRSQAEQILKKFFERAKPTGFSIVHEGKSRQDIEYKIGELSTKGGGTYRVTINMKTVSGKTYIHQLRIE